MPPPESGWIDRWLLPYVRDSSLWPVLAVVVGHVVVLVAPLVLWTLREQRPAAAVALALFAGLCGVGIYAEVRRTRRPGALSGVVLVTWLLIAAAAVVADRQGIF